MSKKAAAKGGTSAKASAANTLPVEREAGKSEAHLQAKAVFSALVANADTARTFAQPVFGETGIGEAVAILREKTEKVQRGDLSDVEARLSAQAVALDAIFNGMAKRAALNMGQHIGACEAYLRMALKAQAQCRATLETLAEIKYPKAPTFVRQQNVAYQQQVNNDDCRSKTRTHAHAEEKQIQQNELLEDQSHERTHLDSGAATAAGRSNPALETVAAVHRADERGR
ncbi:MAG: hypothetical protein WA924_11600 [Burkholderiaceae bacterium]